MEEAKVSAAVEACLTRSEWRSLGDIADFMTLLRDSPHWSDLEIQEVQTRVIRGMLARQEQASS